MNKEYKDIDKSVKKALADFVGIEPDDIEEDYSLVEDLHMKPTDLTDFAQILSNMGLNTEKLDFTEIETFAELMEFLIQPQ
jgi:hypothetical protein